MNGLAASAAAILLLSAGIEPRSAEPPSAAFRAEPGHPSAGLPVRFADESEGAPAFWRWSFGDGEKSDERSPVHRYAAAGTYTVTLIVGNASGRTSATETIEVTAAETLRLVSSHPLDVTLDVADPQTGRSGAARAVGVSDAFGYFTFPDAAPASAAPVAQVFVKILDSTAAGGGYRVFWGGLTDLDYAITLRDTVTGETQTYRRSEAEAAACPTTTVVEFRGDQPLPSPTRTPTPTRTISGRTPTPTWTATPTPTQTPAPSVIVVRLRAIYWQWDFVTGPDRSSTPPFPGVNTITLKKGQTYEFHIYNDGPVLEPQLPPHSFSGVSALGLNGVSLATGDAGSIQTITPDVTGDFPYLCTYTDCGTGANQHDNMHGVIRVVP
jgi:PKD repeat protein